MTEPSGGQAATVERASELADRLQAVERRIEAAAAAVGRADRPELIVVTKFFPVSDLVALADAGARHVGENREQEFGEKVAYLRAQRPDLLKSVTKHFIGQIQSKKARHIARDADVVHTVDRTKLIPKLAAGACDAEKVLGVLLQVDLDGSNPDRGGAAPDELPGLADAVAAEGSLKLLGLMAVAPLGEEPAAAFSRLAEIRANFLVEHPEATMLSAGMSHDLEEAVAIGATHLRVGTAILGSRPAPR